MKKSSFCKNAASAKKAVILSASIALALCLSIPAVLAFSTVLNILGNGNVKEK